MRRPWRPYRVGELWRIVQALRGEALPDATATALLSGYRRRVRGLVAATEALRQHRRAIDVEDIATLRDELVDAVETLDQIFRL